MTDKTETGDFYALADALPDNDQRLLARLRAFLATEVAPTANEHWIHEEFPYELIGKLGGLGIAGLSYDGYGCAGRSSLLDGFVALEFARVDPSIATFFFGVHTGARDGLDLPLWLRGGTEEDVAAGDGPVREGRRFRSHRARGRLRRGPRADHHGPPGRGRMGFVGPEEVDRQRDFRRCHGDLGPRCG
ncbi:acyl-CoA dehydrogenase family protein [Fodinicola feengrottensis]|uniref:acyl-CoA dehydrogenase family protein n=1 Tax=Fodinicola feengrottensis TaxID=435914 RepID=UPI002442B473|nr:acyl-CoA dehydrogenase family protein [Fodinicola feengrottensis]